MLRMQKTMDQISEKITCFVEEALETNFQDYRLSKKRFDQTMQSLQHQLGETVVSEEKEAIRQQIASTLLFSGLLGLGANLRRFLDPLTGDFLAADSEIYLREALSRKLPDYEMAQEKRQHFYDGLTSEQQELYREITEYVSYMETAGPHLAHYFGYLLGNVLLERVIPGYTPDLAYCLRYSHYLNNYFGSPLAS